MTLLSWQQFVQHPHFVKKRVPLILVSSSIFALLPHFFSWIQNRSGSVLADPLLNFLPSYDLTILIFGLLYVAVFGSIYRARSQPEVIFKGFVAYAVLALLRMVLMASLPLEPPSGMVTLIDPIVDLLISGGAPLTKDLFFSGHTSTLALLSLAIPAGRFQLFLRYSAITIGLALLVQHVHYTVDVLVAPLAAWTAWGITSCLFRRLGIDPSL